MATPLAIGVLGATGRMGRLLLERIEAADDLMLAAAVSSANLGPGCFGEAAVVVDFSLPAGLRAALPHLGERALVSGTTGLDADLQAAVEVQATRAPVLQAANFSLGVNLLLDLVARAAAALPDADLEIVESHHRHKRDAPSGTALALGRAAAEARGTSLDAVARHGREGSIGSRPRGEIGFHAIRGGGVVGEHTVTLHTDEERVLLGHIAQNRRVFADGALTAARWLAGRAPGTYEMAQVLFQA